MTSPSFNHVTVLAEEAVRLLAPRPGGVYCDGTVGGGGHAERVLDASAPDGRLVGIDRDPNALEAARARLSRFGERVTLVHGVYSEAPRVLASLGLLPIDGFLLDLGISSPQVDNADRGFSFQKEGPLDMRMDPTSGETALELLRRLEEPELVRLLFRYGDEQYARKIARGVKLAVVEGRIETTLHLARVVAEALPARELVHRRTDPATRTFQALRIAVNDELHHLERFLLGFLDLLAPSGTAVVIAFHSLEDHLVKNRFRDLSRHPGLPPDIAAAMGVRATPLVELLTRKSIGPSDEEIAQNPRARSAHLRAVRKT